MSAMSVIGRWFWVATALAALLVGCGDGGGGVAPTGGDAQETPADAEASDGDVDPAGPDVAEVQLTEHPGCEGYSYTGTYLLPGPCEQGFDAALDAKARRYDRCWRAFNAAGQGLNTDVSIALDQVDDRALVETWVQDHDGWDFAPFAGKEAVDVITTHHKVAGLYAGVGITADAMRYAVLRDQGYPAGEVDIAREHLIVGLEGLHRAATLPGVPGVVARGTARKDLPGTAETETFPLFDGDGSWVPLEKNNGTWREDLSGQYPGWIFEDSISRDQMLGWVSAAATSWEVIRDDPTFDAALKDQLQADALAIGSELMVVRPNGYDLEIWDAEGRRTLHGCLHEHNLDCKLYADPDREDGLGGFDNGFHALMALSFAASWAYVSEDPTLTAWLHDQLLGERQLHIMVRDVLGELVWAGQLSNYSNYNMAFGSIWLALRYLDHAEAQEALREALISGLYAIGGAPNQPEILKQSLFDFIYAAGAAGARARAPLAGAPDLAAVGRGVETLHEFQEAPYWDYGVINCPDAVCDCDDKSVDSAACTAVDGQTAITVLGCVGRNCDLIADGPIPMALRPPSNYFWRSNPLKPNGGGNGTNLLPGVDFRFAYWLGRFVQVSH